jgi:rhodanese-related sulfurtransferase
MKKHSLAFVEIVNLSRKRVTEINATQAHDLCLSDPRALLIDVREDREFAIDSCKGSIHIGKGVIERDIEKYVPEKARPIILYCGGGFRSALAADAVQSMGYTRVYSMDGGIRRWRQVDLPMDTRTPQ